MVEALQRGELRVAEEYILLCETDHLFLKPLPNLASTDEAVGYPFHYMLPTRNPVTIALMRRFAGEEHHAQVQQVGPSPVLMSVAALSRVAVEWRNVSFALKRDPEADAEFGWMLEMWGYSVAAARTGVRHKLLDTLQIESASQFGTQITDRDAQPTHYILHYTFSHEYSLEGALAR